MKPSSPRNLFEKTALTAAGIVVAFLLIEVILRILYPWLKYEYPFPKGLYINDPDLGYVPNPNFKGKMNGYEFSPIIEINSQGFRDYEVSIKKNAIVGLGDSYTMGYNVALEDTYLKKIEKRLNMRTINCGVGGYGTKQELIFYKKFASKYTPIMVLLGYHIGSDLFDNMEDINRRKVVEGFVTTNKRINYLKRHFVVFYFLKRRVAANETLKDVFQKFHLLKYLGISEDKQLLQFYETTHMDLSAHWENTFRLLKEFKSTVQKEGTTFILILIPPRYQVIDSMWHEVTAKYSQRGINLDRFKPNRLILSFCDNNGIPLIDLTGVFIKESSKGEVLYHRYDPHWNENGHLLASECICSFLKSNILSNGRITEICESRGH